MSSNNSTTPRTADNNNNNGNQQRNGKNVTASTYYVAVIIVVFLLIALAIVFRIIYTKKYKRRNPAIDEPAAESREREERLAMERRGEEVGLPTYRESILLPNNDTVLAATPMSDVPYLTRPSTSDTLPNPVTNPQIARSGDLSPREAAEPPKYEVDPTDQEPDSTTFPPATREMRMSSHSTSSTLVLPSINVNQASVDPTPLDSNPTHQQSSTTSPLPSSDLNA